MACLALALLAALPAAGCGDGDGGAGRGPADLALPARDVAIDDPRCTDGARNGIESDVDCGGVCAACADGRRCGSDADCESRVCRGGACLARVCDDGARDGLESDVDCGGGRCAPCADGRRCGRGADCTSSVCGPDGRCAEATCGDGVKNAEETDVDCGGGAALCARCTDGRGCGAPRDCASRICEGGACRPAGACGASGFCFQHPTPTGVTLRGLATLPGGARLAVGDAGTLLSWNGLAWAPAKVPVSTALRAVWLAAADRAFAVGDGGVVLAWDGTAWTQQASGTVADLRAVAGAGPRDVWAVGTAGTALHFDGAAWRAVPSGTQRDLDGVAVVDGARAFLVGAAGTLLAWDGMALAPRVSGTQAALHAVQAVDGTTVMAVGDGGTIVSGDGDRFTARVEPAAGGLPLRALWLGARDDGWAAGDVGLRLDRQGWRAVEVPLPAFALAPGDGDVLLAGEGIVRLLPEGAWGEVPVPTTSALTAAWLDGAQGGFAVGRGGAVLRWDGRAFSSWDSGSRADWNAVAGTSMSDVMVVGAAGAAAWFDGSAFRAVPMPVMGDLFGVAPLGDGTWLAVGANGVILRGDPRNGFASLPSPTGNALMAVWAASPKAAWAVGLAGTIARFDGTRFALEPSPTQERLLAVRGSHAADVWIAGTNGTLVHDGGNGWILDFSAQTRSTLMGLALGSGHAAVDAVGEEGSWLTQLAPGAPWLVRPAQSSSDLRAVAALPSVAFAVGDDATVLRYERRFRPESRALRRGLRGIAATAADRAFAVGDDLLLEWDGGAWIPRPTSGAHLAAVSLRGARGVAVGASGALRILSADGHRFEAVPTVTPADLRGVDLDGTEALAVGAGGVLVHGDLSGNAPRFALEKGPTADDLEAVFAVGGGRFVAVGAAGRIVVREPGGAYATPRSGTNRTLRAVWGSAANALWAAGDGGTLLFFDGLSWSARASGSAANLLAVGGSAANDAWVMGEGGVALRWDGKAITALASLGVTVRSLACAGGRCFAAGEGGAIWAR